jgi:hypothetical protein
MDFPASGRKGSQMKPNPGNAKWSPLFAVIIQMAALGLCSWAMSAARNRGRELPGGTTPPAATPPQPAP